MVVYFLIQEILAQERFADGGGFGELMNVVWNIMNFHCLQHIEWVAFCVWRSEQMARLEVQIWASLPQKNLKWISREDHHLKGR